jgi:hypothetical protein
MVTSGLMSNSLLPRGLRSSGQFLQWGYWTGTLNTPDTAGAAVIRQDAAHINTWIAGVISSGPAGYRDWHLHRQRVRVRAE